MEKRIRKDLKMDISVIIPAYNCENTIVECLNSVIKQTYYSYICEVIIINDGSIDHTKQKIYNFIKNCGDNKIEVIDQKNSGVSVARNNGIKKAKGTWIAFLDSDDVWLENKIERQIKTILEHREICFLGTLSTGSPNLILYNKKIEGLYNANIFDLCYKSFPVTPSVLVKKECLINVGLFDEKQNYSEDMNCFQKICLKYNYYILPEPLVTCGIQKKDFAESGLTSNLKEMYKGRNKNLKELYQSSDLSLFWYLFFRIFSLAKYCRRKIKNIKLRSRK